MNDLDQMLESIRVEFVSAPAWAEAQPLLEYRRTKLGGGGFGLVPGKPKTWPPPDPFSVAFAVDPQLGPEDVRVRYLKPAGQALALHARMNGASGPEMATLSISAGPAFQGRPTIKVTAEPKA